MFFLSDPLSNAAKTGGIDVMVHVNVRLVYPEGIVGSCEGQPH